MERRNTVTRECINSFPHKFHNTWALTLPFHPTFIQLSQSLSEKREKVWQWGKTNRPPWHITRSAVAMLYIYTVAQGCLTLPTIHPGYVSKNSLSSAPLAVHLLETPREWSELDIHHKPLPCGSELKTQSVNWNFMTSATLECRLRRRIVF